MMPPQPPTNRIDPPTAPLPPEVEHLNIMNNMQDIDMSDDVDSPPRTANGHPGAVASGPFGFLKRFVFQKLLIFSLSRLMIYLYKLYEDVNSVNEYYSSVEIYFLIISAAALVVPPIFYAIYLIGANLAKDDILDKTEIGTKAVNGMLLFPWQIKRLLDVLHFSAQRVCQWRTPDNLEEEDMNAMQRSADILEFFEDFYAGFLQIILQLYIYFGTIDLVSTHTVTAKYFIGQLVGSSLSVISMMIAVRRRDDGPLTGFVSFFGWSSLIVSRILVFTLVATYIHSGLFILCLIHVLSVSMWVYNIAIESYMATTASPTTESTQWTLKRKRASLAILVFLFFGIPSLLIWPIMFQLKEGRRPLIFLMIVTLENLFLLGIWFVCEISFEGLALNNTHVLLVIAIVLTTLAGVFFLLIYVFCKPKFTDQVVLYEIRESRTTEAPTLIKLNGPSSRSFNATQYGIYYEFCDLVFKLPSTHKIGPDLEEVRRLQANS